MVGGHVEHLLAALEIAGSRLIFEVWILVCSAGVLEHGAGTPFSDFRDRAGVSQPNPSNVGLGGLQPLLVP